MTAHEIPSTIADIIIIGAVIFYNKIYAILLLLVTQDDVHTWLIDLKDVFGVIVGIMGMILMYVKIKKARKQLKDLDTQKRTDEK